MPHGDANRRKIADTVRRTRVVKGLDKEAAARAAKVNSITWKRVEDAESVRDASLGKVLTSLDLPDVDTIFASEDVTIYVPTAAAAAKMHAPHVETANADPADTLDPEEVLQFASGLITYMDSTLRESADSDQLARLEELKSEVEHIQKLLGPMLHIPEVEARYTRSLLRLVMKSFDTFNLTGAGRFGDEYRFQTQEELDLAADVNPEKGPNLPPGDEEFSQDDE